MRIISGKWGGRVLKVPSGLPVRPTTDRTKESLFNMLAHQMEIEGMEILEICCGTGNISLEFASRGASKVVAFDKDRRCVQALKEIVQQLDASDQIKVLQGEVEKLIEKPEKWLPNRPAFDLIFLDPPYALAHQHDWIPKIFASFLLKSQGLVILEHSSLISFEKVENWIDTRKYGSSSLSFFQRNETSK